MEFNRISTVYKESLEGMTNLISLNLANNKISKLGPQIFKSLDRLTHLDLSANNIAAVSKNAFDVSKICHGQVSAWQSATLLPISL